MKNTAIILINLLTSIIFLQAQDCRDISLYDKYIDTGKELVDEGNYVKALEYYASAKDFCSEKTKEVDKLITEIITRISEEQKNTQQALLKAEKLINAFYFYDDKYALAFGEKSIENGSSRNVFYFIDKKGNDVRKLGRWEKAEQFSYMSLAKVWDENNIAYYLDTLGYTYRINFKLEKKPDTKITALNLSNQYFDSFPIGVLEYPQLQILIISQDMSVWSKIKNIPSDITKLKNLTFLSLNGIMHEIKELPKNIGQLTNLKFLNLGGYNQLNSLPESFVELKNLISLRLGGYIIETPLTTLPENFGQLQNLQRLDLSGNHLKYLPESFGQLQNLKKLNLERNNLKYLPESFGQLQNLQELNLSGRYFGVIYNQFTTLPESFGQLQNLKKLNLSGNLVKTLPESFGQLQNLQELDLRNNPISEKELEKIKDLLPNCSILFNYEQFVISASQEGDYSKAYRNQKKVIENEGVINYNSWWNLSWYALFVGEYEEAIHAVQKTLELNPNAQEVETNLALGYLLNDQWEEAEVVYLRWKGRGFPNDDRLCDEVFLQDIADLEAAGIIHPNFAKVREMFKK